MESEYARLADTIISKAKSHPKPRFLVAIAGAPGSGKTTTAKAVQQQLNDNETTVALLSMDGFHLPRATLDKLPNREEAYQRRGAPWTFDVELFLKFTRHLRAWADTVPAHETPALYAPTFDHHTKDPVENGTTIDQSASIVILEGNYLLLDKEEWREVADLVDLCIFINVDLGIAQDRLARRHVEAGIEKTLDDGYARVNGNDYLNGLEIRGNLIQPDIVLESVSE